VVGGGECLTCVLPILYPREHRRAYEANLASPAQLLARRTMVHNFFGGAVAIVVQRFFVPGCSASMATPQFELCHRRSVFKITCVGEPTPRLSGYEVGGLVRGKRYSQCGRGWWRTAPTAPKDTICADRASPKTLAMIGRRYRAETSDETRRPLPERWLALIHSIDNQEKKRCGDDQANER
jgi:hypothetical protein